MQDYENTAPTAPKRVPWNKGELRGNKAAAPAKARLVDPDQAAGRGTDARLGNV